MHNGNWNLDSNYIDAKWNMTGCPNDLGRDKMTLDFTLIDYYDTSNEKLILAEHEPGQCRCPEYDKLNSLEDKLILKLGTFYGSGMNSRDEVISKSRFNWK